MKDKFNKLAKGKSSKDCTKDEAIDIYLNSIENNETPEQRKKRILAFRCGW